MTNERQGKPKQGSTSPGNSPSSQQLAAINLESSSPQLSPEIKAQFDEFKAKEMREHHLSQRAATTATLREFSTTFKKQPADASSKTAAAGKAEPVPATKSKLNPHAKAFTFNPGAKAFVPGAAKKAEAAANKAASGTAPPAQQAHPPGAFPANAAGAAMFPPAPGVPGGFQGQQNFPPPQPQMGGFPVVQCPPPLEGEFGEDVDVMRLYANNMTKGLSNTPAFDPEATNPGWPHGANQLPFRTAEEQIQENMQVQAQQVQQAPPFNAMGAPQQFQHPQRMPPAAPGAGQFMPPQQQVMYMPQQGYTQPMMFQPAAGQQFPMPQGGKGNGGRPMPGHMPAAPAGAAQAGQPQFAHAQQQQPQAAATAAGNMHVAH